MTLDNGVPKWVRERFERLDGSIEKLDAEKVDGSLLRSEFKRFTDRLNVLTDEIDDMKSLVINATRSVCIKEDVLGELQKKAKQTEESLEGSVRMIKEVKRGRSNFLKVVLPTALAALLGAVWFVATVAAKTEMHEADIQSVKTRMETVDAPVVSIEKACNSQTDNEDIYASEGQVQMSPEDLSVLISEAVEKSLSKLEKR